MFSYKDVLCYEADFKNIGIDDEKEQMNVLEYFFHLGKIIYGKCNDNEKGC